MQLLDEPSPAKHCSLDFFRQKMIAPMTVCLLVFAIPSNGLCQTELSERVLPPGTTKNQLPLGVPIAQENLDGQFAFQVLEKMCEIGPRVSGTAAMTTQQEFLAKHFESLGATIGWQPFQGMHPVNQTPVEFRNLLVQFHPDRQARILLACHYDTRPFPDLDRTNPTGTFLGANDGASGVGLLCELGKFMPELQSDYGVDFVFFDAEEFVFQNGRDPYFLGSTHFANQYIATPPPWRYVAGVLVDMVGDKDLNIYLEINSWKDAREIARQIWDVAQRMDVKEFIPRTRHEVRDDHLPLINIAKIPTCNVIDFDYPSPSDTRKNRYWHTTEDTPDKCSAESLAKVGNVLLAWLREVRMKK